MKHVKRFKARVLKRPDSPGSSALESRSQSLSSALPGPAEPSIEKRGLFKLAESKAAPDSLESTSYPVDIVAVHGLNGDAFSTWTHKLTGILWLKDLLPNFLPGCRVYTYGYPSKIFSQSSERVQEYALNLLISVRDIYEDTEHGKRSVIFIYHSLGGVVFKQALVTAHQDNRLYGEVLNSIIGVLFLATPHRGSNAATLGSICGRVNAPAVFFVLSDLERTCMTLLSDHDVARDVEPPPKASIWHINALLWLTGNPGCGKTMLFYSLAQYFTDAREKSRNVLVYLCQNKNKQTDGRAVLIGLILQIIDRHRSLIRHIRAAFEKQGSSIINSFASLWRIFLEFSMDPKSGSLYVILDALDECEKASCHQLLKSIVEMLNDSSQPMKADSHIKLLITSRPFLHPSYANSPKVLQSQISIDDDQTGYTEDLRIFIQERIHEISLNRQFSNEIREFLYHAITPKADRTFLWIHMVLASIEKSLLTSRKEFQKIVAGIPEDLAEISRGYLSAIPKDHQEDALKLLNLLLACSRPLSLDEFNIAFTMDPEHTSTEDIMQDADNSITHTVQGILGSLVRVTGQQISLVHQSLKDFLLDQDTPERNDPSDIPLVNSQSSTLQMATVGIQYLLLDDFMIDLFPTGDSSTTAVTEEADPFDELPMGDFKGDFWEQENVALDLDYNVLFRDPDAQHPDICDSLVTDYPLYNYACLHWAEHFTICEDEASDELKDAAKSLLDNDTANCRNWLNFYRVRALTLIEGDLLDQDPIILASQFNLSTAMNDLLLDNEPDQATKDQGLYWASRLGHHRIVSSLLTAGADPNAKQVEKQTSLTVASEHGNLSSVRVLLADSRTNANEYGRNGRNALSFTSGDGHDAIVKEILKRKGCNPDEPDNVGGTPFFWAVGGGHHSIISTLARLRSVNVTHMIRPDAQLFHGLLGTASVDNDKRNAISWASARGHHEVLVKLLKAGCPGIDDEDIDNWTPLAWAIQTDSSDTVQALVSDERAQLERRDGGGRTALSWAVEYGHLEVVKVLLRAGADHQTRSIRGNTPSMIAKQFGRNDMVKEMEVYGA
ncbi:hypothetical protein FBEOM_9336 [Fusarium beomiforme]|uniref:NACHT domain-containing protein n=1 Tax=Fusarium beomiforme TaxID=44412 RepID=A0A9P5AF35_9HYPO|nr:hypothetical protein FBEOM_9336 [Fusarium beomiforme]